MELFHTFNEENVSEQEASTYKVRKAVRAIVIDQEDNLGLIHITNSDRQYYELPGGGVEEGESLEQACIRECKEEIGCVVEIVRELGMTREYRKKLERINESYCFVVKVVGEKGLPELTEKEKALGVEPVWFSKEESFRLIQQSLKDLKDHIELYDKYILERSIVFLENMK
ncbi:MAG TPA: NUDIX domain-containing protein [Candidatus Paceibacterota bacterium]|jgi:ADP-ribose pyrophosphatase YjhB (NUDIX family)|nr:NUDIX domain-containing protein [Candidatus Paceibacterota bacterium]